MPKLFLGNFDFEHRLADPNYSASATLKRLNAELATSWLAIAEDGDWIWTPIPIDPRFFSKAVESGLPHVVPVSDLKSVPRDNQWIPWGWSAEVRKLADRTAKIVKAPPDPAVRMANSRATSERLEREWNVGVAGSRRVGSIEDFHDAVRSLRSSSRWVVKAEFGMSARERILGAGPPRESDENWVRRRLASDGMVFFEPWVDRIHEVGIQIDVPQHGAPLLMGLTPMHVDARGQYAGSWFAFAESRFPLGKQPWGEAIEVALRAAKELQSFDYFGPLGIDAMLYRDNKDEILIRPLQDINARWTMGRLSLACRRFAEFESEGFWQQGVFDTPFEPGRIISTSPLQIGEVQCGHCSRILFGKPITTKVFNAAN